MFIPDESIKHIKIVEIYKIIVILIWCVALALLFSATLGSFTQLTIFIGATYILILSSNFNQDTEQQEDLNSFLLTVSVLLIALGLFLTQPIYNFAGFMLLTASMLKI